MKENNNIFILGDSYSTYEGYNPDGYRFYYWDKRAQPPIVNDVDKTWWRILAKENNFNIVVNDSFSGSAVCNMEREAYPISTSYISRIDKYIAEGFFSENSINTMFIFGGTNDSWNNATVGDVKFSNWTDDELKCVLPAFCYLLNTAQQVVKKIVVIINDGLKQEIIDGFIKACEKFKVVYVCLNKIDKQSGHPTELGMKQISEQVSECLK
jgi:hypothetical protein